MAEQIYPHALTTVQRIKDRLSITANGFDALLLRLINSITDVIESDCNRHFKETTYSNEIYSIHGNHQEYLFLNNIPVTAITSFQYRLGLKSNPSWTDFLADQWELLEDGGSGIIRVYAPLWKWGNAVKISYTAGFKISWADYGDTSKHNLPADLTEACERLVVRLFKRREAEGKSQENFNGAVVNWKADIDSDIADILAGYKRVPQFV